MIFIQIKNYSHTKKIMANAPCLKGDIPGWDPLLGGLANIHLNDLFESLPENEGMNEIKNETTERNEENESEDETENNEENEIGEDISNNEGSEIDEQEIPSDVENDVDISDDSVVFFDVRIISNVNIFIKSNYFRKRFKSVLVVKRRLMWA